MQEKAGLYAGVPTCRIPSIFRLVFTSGTYAQTFNTLDLSFYNPDFVAANGGTAAGTEAA